MGALDEILESLDALIDDHLDADEAEPRKGTGNFRCENCEGCDRCRFCTGCRDCDDCTYCGGCVGCAQCTQSTGLHDCEETSHSDNSRGCARCSYVTLCLDCEDCVQCFACVGLRGEEFHILNEKHARKDYLRKVRELREVLKDRASDGRLPGWLIEEDDEDEADDEGEADQADQALDEAPEPDTGEPDQERTANDGGKVPRDVQVMDAFNPPPPPPFDPGKVQELTMKFDDPAEPWTPVGRAVGLPQGHPDAERPRPPKKGLTRGQRPSRPGGSGVRGASRPRREDS